MSWRYALTPKWIVRHLAVVALITGMLFLLAWQLDRHREKRDHIELVEGRMAARVAPVEDLLAPGLRVGAGEVDDVLYRRVSAEGPYLADRTVVVENRTSALGSPGGWVLTPLDLGGGRSVLVNRGFVGYDAQGRIVAPPPPSGRVRVEGLLFPSQRRGSFGAADPERGTLSVVARVDLERIDAQVDGELLPAYVQLTSSTPGEPPVAEGAAAVEALGPPELSEGSHLSYAVQWGIFSTVAGVGYVLLLRKLAREQGRDRATTGAGGLQEV